MSQRLIFLAGLEPAAIRIQPFPVMSRTFLGKSKKSLAVVGQDEFGQFSVLFTIEEIPNAMLQNHFFLVEVIGEAKSL
jgi:hypothetical protein